MPAWVSISLADVRAEAAVARIEAAVSTDRAEIASYFAGLRDGIVAEVRAKIGSHPRHAIDSDTSTVPPEFRGYVCLRILSRLLSRPGATGDDSTYRLTEDQRTELERRQADLDKVAEGKLAVSAPTLAATASEVSSIAPAVYISGPARRHSREQLNGL
jgi:hypothetical protein